MDSTRQNRRSTKKQIDYKVFRESGVIVKKPPSYRTSGIISEESSSLNSLETSTSSDNESLNKLLLSQLQEAEIQGTTNMVEGVKNVEMKLSLLLEDICDYLDENPVDSSIYVAEDHIDLCVAKAEQMRSDYRKLNKQLLELIDETEYDRRHSETFHAIIGKMKLYIKCAKERKARIRKGESEKQNEKIVLKYKRESDETIRKETSRFLIDEFDKMIAQLLTDFRISNKDASDEEIRLRKDQYSVQLLESDRISKNFQELLQILPSSYPRRKEVMITMNKEYNNISKQMKIYSLLFLKFKKENWIKRNHLVHHLSMLNYKGSKDCPLKWTFIHLDQNLRSCT